MWYSKNKIAYFLWPLSLLYQLLFHLHRLSYQLGFKKTYHATVPVIVIGNLTVGGTGKTPLTIALTKLLVNNGYKPGIVSRGYKGKLNNPYLVLEHTDSLLVGDEAILLAKKTAVPVVISTNRGQGVLLLENLNCNVVICDDGLQHHALKKDIEIILVDSQRKFGNGFCLPAGPLRQSPKALFKADFVIEHGTQEDVKYSMLLKTNDIYNLLMPQMKLDYSSLTKRKIHAVAAIGHPQRFFDTLRQLGLTITEHEFPDHHPYSEKDFKFCKKQDLIIMTEKDAVKCKAWAKENYWVLSVEALVSDLFNKELLAKLKSVN